MLISSGWSWRRIAALALASVLLAGVLLIMQAESAYACQKIAGSRT